MSLNLHTHVNLIHKKNSYEKNVFNIFFKNAKFFLKDERKMMSS